jgi:threonine/homoserine/homoserine lactone efflux protein
MEYILKSAAILAKASGYNPFISTLVVMLFYIGFVAFEATIERLVFGERFEHWLDPIFCLIFIAYAALSVYECAYRNFN